METVGLHSVRSALDALQRGQMIIVTDDASRENEGDIIMSAQYMTEEKMAFIIRHTGGVVCLALNNEIADQLDLPYMVKENTSAMRTSFTVSIEASKGVTTGISAADRTQTILSAIHPTARPKDLCRPGHVFPLRAKNGGVLVRAGHTEASVDLMRLSGLREAAVISELINDDGTMMRDCALKSFAEKNDIPILSIADLIAHRKQCETTIRKEAETELETDTGIWKMCVYTDEIEKKEHVALVKGDIDPTKSTLVRVHSECLTGDTFGSRHCDCGHQMQKAMQMIHAEGNGVFVYLRQEGRGIGLLNKVKAYELQQKKGLDTVDANYNLGFKDDLREYGIGAQILKDIGVGNLRLLTNNPKKIIGLNGYGLHIIEQVSIEHDCLTSKQKKYLKTKKIKLGHNIKNIL
jgi:3,4-dihydroxy 2-butanone 4-phosphate synthase / GTP cyclohydrolase II